MAGSSSSRAQSCNMKPPWLLLVVVMGSPWTLQLWHLWPDRHYNRYGTAGRPVVQEGQGIVVVGTGGVVVVEVEVVLIVLT